MMMHHAEFTEICGFGCVCFLNAFPFFLFFSPLRKGVSGVCVCDVWQDGSKWGTVGRVILSVWSQEMLTEAVCYEPGED